MRPIPLILALGLFAPVVHSEGYSKCILDNMPGSENEAFTTAVIRTCLSKHPGSIYDDVKGSGIGWFGFKSGDACTLKRARDTKNQRAAGLIAVACRCLYDDGIVEDEACAYRQVPPWITFKKSE